MIIYDKNEQALEKEVMFSTYVHYEIDPGAESWLESISTSTFWIFRKVFDSVHQESLWKNLYVHAVQD